MSEPRTDPNEIRRTITAAIRSCLIAKGHATKAELSRSLSLSFPTISKFVTLMEKEGELRSIGLDDSSGGRRAGRYAYNPDFMLGLAVYLEKEETRYSVFDCLGEAREEGIAPSVLTEGIEALQLQVEELMAKYPRMRSLAIGVPGSVKNGKIGYIPGYGRYEGLELKAYFEERLQIPVRVENDMNAAVLGFAAKEDEAESASLVYLYFGNNGPGAGIMANGTILRGNTSFSGEISFVPMDGLWNFGEALQERGFLDGRTLDEVHVDAVARLVAAFTVILNPKRIVFCDSEADGKLLEQIAHKSRSYVPAEHLPELVSSHWPSDYLGGLKTLSLEAMISQDISSTRTEG
ncbi:ROK family protein [Paenibacillus sp. D51F]